MVQKTLSKLFWPTQYRLSGPAQDLPPGPLSSPLLGERLPAFLLLFPHHGPDWQSPWAGFSHCWSWGREQTLLSGQAACSPPVSSPELLARKFTEHLAGAWLLCGVPEGRQWCGAHTTALLIPRAPVQPCFAY